MGVEKNKRVRLHVLYAVSPLFIPHQNATAADVSASHLYDYTARVQAIRDNVTVQNITDCCDYNYQLLDKFCVSQSPVSQ